ncbi:UDP-glycosyltransferase 87A2-like [Neltuma alba]|uniref:UDP-glycosyltransferase 87A2-like n=1 Tax=Neltuma alba TaxID=207710 RepID=UPI0010A5120F|nr:UDP-glycosyltransferase 87A2-like [Prosopis alba]
MLLLVPSLRRPIFNGVVEKPYPWSTSAFPHLRSRISTEKPPSFPGCREPVAMSMELPPSFKGHVVALPFPTRGHVNPLIHLCKFLASRRPCDVIITLVVTQEWLGFIQSYPKPHTIRFATIPNVIPLDAQILDDVPSFTEAVATKMRPALEQLLDQLHPPVTAIVSDAQLATNLRNVPVALLWTMSASFFETFRLGKTDCLLLNTIQELEAERINYLKAILPFRVYPIGPAIPFMELDSSASNVDHITTWLDCQPNLSVLYISKGSSFSMSRPQMEELAAALKTCEIRFLWVGRSDAEWLKEKCGDNGLVVPCSRTAEVWKNGRKVGGDRSEDLVTEEEILEVAKMVADVENEEWKKIKERAKDLKALFRGAIARGGSCSSDMNMNAFVETSSRDKDVYFDVHVNQS